MWLILLILNLINLAISQDFQIYTSKELYFEKNLKIKVNDTNSYSVGCDNQSNYLWMTKQGTDIIKISYEERQQAGCSDSKFNFVIPNLFGSYYTFKFMNEDNIVLEQFIQPNPRKEPIKQYISQNKVYMKQSLSYLEDIYISNITSKTFYMEFKVCTDANSIDLDLYSIIGDNLNQKTIIQPYYGNYYMYSDIGSNISFYSQIIPKQQYIVTPIYSIRYQIYDTNSSIQYDQFSINGSLILTENEESIDIIIPRIESQIQYSYIKIIIFFSYDRFAQLIQCTLGDVNVKSYHSKFFDSVILYQNKHNNDHVQFQFKGEQYDRPYHYNYTYIFAQVYIGEQQITLPIGGSNFNYQSNKINYLPYFIVFSLITGLMSLFSYFLYRYFKNRQIIKDIELNYYNSS